MNKCPRCLECEVHLCTLWVNRQKSKGLLFVVYQSIIGPVFTTTRLCVVVM